MAPGLGMALALFILEPLVLLAVTVLGTVWLPTLGNGILVFALYVVSMVGGMIEQIGSCWKVPLPSIYIGVISSLLLPADVVYRRLVHTLVGRMAPADMSMGITNLQDFLGPCGSLSTPSNWMLLYILVYIAGLLAAAVYVFYIYKKYFCPRPSWLKHTYDRVRK
ncbi:MAG: hypothetical protein IMW95_09325 [Moorella humiferrea]|nr:hypothetical protein [Moorella humiferrea]